MEAVGRHGPHQTGGAHIAVNDVSTGERAAGDDVVPRLVRWSWGMGSLGTITYLNVVSALILVYLTTIVGIEAAVAGTLIFAARVIDAFSDPLMGWITDRTRTRWGRRRPYLFAGAVVCGLALPMVYSLHAWIPDTGTIAFAFAALVVYSLGFSMFNVPYLAMPVEMTTDRMQRIRIVGSRVFFMMLGTVIGSAAAPYVLELLGNDARAYGQIGWLVGGVVFVAMMTAFVGTAGGRASTRSTAGPPLLQQLRSVWDNKPFMTLVAVKIMQFISIAWVASTMAFYVTVVLKQDYTLLSVFGIVTTLTVVISLPLWRRWSARLTKRRAFMIGIVGDVLTTPLWLFAEPGNAYAIVVARSVCTGFFASAIMLNSQAMWLDTIDYDKQRSGLNREGMYTSIYVFVERIGYSIPPLLLGYLLTWFGFDKSLPLTEQPDSAKIAVYWGIVWAPMILYSLAFVFLTRYRLPDDLGNPAADHAPGRISP